MDIECNNCSSKDIVKYGKRAKKDEQVQTYLCKSCGMRFTPGKGFLHTSKKPNLIAISLDLYYGGLSLRQIKNHLAQFYSTKVSHTTIYYWIAKYTERITKFVENFPPQNIGTLNADETGMYFRKNLNWLWLMQDKDTKLIVGNLLTKHKFVDENVNVFKKSKKFLGRDPKLITTDSFRGYPMLAEQNFPTSTHKHYAGFKSRFHNNTIERTNGEVKSRYKRMRGFKSIKTGNRTMNGWRFYFNFIKPHLSIDGKTPAEEAGIGINLQGNKWIDIIDQTTRFEQAHAKISNSHSKGT